MKTMKNILQIPRRGVPPGCAAIADLLPLLDHPGLDAEDEKAVLAHVASCSACRDRQAGYLSLERDARRFLSPKETSPRYQTKELLAAVIGEDLIPSSSSTAPAPIRRLHRARRRRSLIPALAPVAAVLAVLLLAIALFSGRIGGLGPGGSSLLPGSDTELDSISMVSSTEGWAVGYSDSSVDDANGSQVVVLHYLHDVWSPVRVPIYGQLFSVSMASATDGWATGVSNTSQLVLHYDGKTWKRVQDVPELGQIQMLSATDGWATSNGNYLWHYDGHTWSKQLLPASLTADASCESLCHFTMTSAVDGWFADNEFNKSSGSSEAAVLLHYSDGQWQISRRLEGAFIASISMASSTDGWAMGQTCNTTPCELNAETKPLLLHFTDGMWVQVKSPLTIGAPMWDVVAMRSASDGWIAGVSKNAIPQLFHYNGSDWSPVRVPLTADKSTDYFRPSGFALPSAGDAWAIGQRVSNRNQGVPLDSGGHNYTPLVTPFMLHYSAGAWSVVPLKGIPYYPV